MDNIILIGFMGSGKTSVGKQLAKKLKYTFCDTDQIIEKECKMSISNIFATEGEEYFRKLETYTIESLIGKLEASVLSVGGGLPMSEGNPELLRRLGYVVYLKASKETILKRLSGDTTRPLLAGSNASEKVDNLLKVRAPIYEAAAHIQVVTDDKMPEEIITEIIEEIRVSIAYKESQNNIK